MVTCAAMTHFKETFRDLTNGVVVALSDASVHLLHHRWRRTSTQHTSRMESTSRLQTIGVEVERYDGGRRMKAQREIEGTKGSRENPEKENGWQRWNFPFRGRILFKIHWR